jgi:membrane fusion protein, multidrug efflux system
MMHPKRLRRSTAGAVVLSCQTAVVLFCQTAVVLLCQATVFGQPVETAKVTAADSERVVKLPGELLPFESVALVARVAGYVDTMAVDRGTAVRKGQIIATLVAPEVAAQVAAARAQVGAAVARRAETDAQLATARLTYERLKAASATTGAVAGLELLRAEESVKSATASLEAQAQAVTAAQASLEAVRALESYLRVVAPFSGRITERLVHPGALVGPSTGPLVRLEQTGRLRLVLSIPEQQYGGIPAGRRIAFTVAAHPGRMFTAPLARVAGSLDAATRSMVVELDVDNRDGALAPGMFPEVTWPVAPPRGTLLVPASAVVTTTERTFVIRVKAGKAEWVPVKKGTTRGEQVEVTGPLAPGDVIVKRGSDEIREGTAMAVK